MQKREDLTENHIKESKKSHVKFKISRVTGSKRKCVEHQIIKTEPCENNLKTEPIET